MSRNFQGGRAHPRWARLPILWINNPADLDKISQWLDARDDEDDPVTRAIEIHYGDTGAHAIALFAGARRRRGIIRCASASLVERAREQLPPHISMTEIIGLNRGVEL